jgi:hypothetical protein
VQITAVISEIESFTGDQNEVAMAILTAAGGDPSTDFCVVTFAPPLQAPVGFAGKDPNVESS